LNSRALDEGARGKKWQKLRLNLHGICIGGKIKWSDPKIKNKNLKGELMI
jgi:hypothetical protein